LYHEPTLPVIRLVDRTAREIGWLAGHSIDVSARRILDLDAEVPIDSTSPDIRAGFERWLYRLGGRFAAILIHPAGRVYPDALGSLPILFDPAGRRVASSPFLLPSSDGEIPDSPLVDELDIYTSGSQYAIGLTPHAVARLLLPSHALELESFRQVRLWPLSPPPAIEPDRAVERIGELVESAIAAAAEAGSASLSLTAGGDSRLLLACSRLVVDRLQLFTAKLPDTLGATDAVRAAEIAAAIGVPHRTLSWVPATDDDVRLWMYRTGALTGEKRGRRATPTYNQLGGKGPYLSGVGQHFARGWKWLPSDGSEMTLTARDLLSRFGIPHIPQFLDQGEQWLSALGHLNPLDVIDLFSLEIRYGGWGGPLTLGYPDAVTTTIYPFGHREIAELVFGLPLEYRRADRLRHDIVAKRWPELDAFPLNETPWRIAAAAWGRRKASQMLKGARSLKGT
jgi:hypothetical protein